MLLLQQHFQDQLKKLAKFQDDREVRNIREQRENHVQEQSQKRMREEEENNTSKRAKQINLTETSQTVTQNEPSYQGFSPVAEFSTLQEVREQKKRVEAYLDQLKARETQLELSSFFSTVPPEQLLAFMAHAKEYFDAKK